MNLFGGMVEYRVVSCIGQIFIGVDTTVLNLTVNEIAAREPTNPSP
jgi:hypothetical protein